MGINRNAMAYIVGRTDDLFTIGFITKEGAEHVGMLFRVVYGEDYPYQDVYDPERLLGEIEEGRLLAVIAYDPYGQPAGYVALARAKTNPRLWEERSLVVDPTYHYTNLSTVLAKYFMNSSVGETLEIDCMFAQAVCHHYFTQVICVKAGWVSCALALDELDKSIFINHNEKMKRVACVMLYWEINEQLTPVYLPAEYDEILRRLALPLKPREFQVSHTGLPKLGVTVWAEQYNPSNQTWKVNIKEIGADWATYLTELLAEAIRRKVVSLQVMLNTACPYIGAATALMRDRGFFLGGLLPHWFVTDGLLMQKVLGKEPDYDDIKLYGRLAKELLAFIRADREVVGRLTGD